MAYGLDSLFYLIFCLLCVSAALCVSACTSSEINKEIRTVELRQKILAATDRILLTALVVLVLGSGLCFGGAVWWFPPALSVVALLLVIGRLVQCVVQWRMA